MIYSWVSSHKYYRLHLQVWSLALVLWKGKKCSWSESVQPSEEVGACDWQAGWCTLNRNGGDEPAYCFVIWQHPKNVFDSIHLQRGTCDHRCIHTFIWLNIVLDLCLVLNKYLFWFLIQSVISLFPFLCFSFAPVIQQWCLKVVSHILPWLLCTLHSMRESRFEKSEIWLNKGYLYNFKESAFSFVVLLISWQICQTVPYAMTPPADKRQNRPQSRWKNLHCESDVKSKFKHRLSPLLFASDQIGFAVSRHYSVPTYLHKLLPIYIFHICMSAGAHSDMCDVKIIICPCLQGSMRSPKFMTAQTVCMPTAHALVYNQLLHTPVQLVQLQHWLFKSFLWFFFQHRFTQFDACQSLMSNSFRSGVYSVEASQQVKLFHMGEQSNVSTWLVLS